MLAMWYLLLAVCMGCGRLGFSDVSVVDALGVEADAPPLPASLVCGARRVAVPRVVPGTDVAVTSIAGGYSVVWAEPGGAVSLATLMATDTSVSGTTLATGPVTAIGGLLRRATDHLLVTANGASQTLWRIDAGGGLTSIATETAVLARTSVVTDETRVPAVWVRADTVGIRATHVSSDGILGTTGTLARGSPIVAIAAADNDNHGHLSWIEDRGGSSMCLQTDLDMTVPPGFGGADDNVECSQLRIDSGPGPRDVIMNVLQAPSGEIALVYRGGFDNFTRTLWPAGRAPRVRFDGTQFWAAWIDEMQPGNTIIVARIEQDGTFVTTSLVGWSVVSDEALEIVWNGMTTEIVAFDGDEIVVFKLCK